MKIGGIFSKVLILLIVGVLAAGIVFIGCKSKEATTGAVSYERVVEPGMDSSKSESMAVFEEEAVAADEADVQYSDMPLAGDRKVIETAYIELEVDKGKFEDVLFRITSMTEQNGGFISSTNSNSDSEGNLTSGSITIRIPHDNYNSVLDRIKDLGSVSSISTTGQDVTEEYVDLESRLKNYEAQEEILLGLMAQSENVSDSVEVQIELSKVQEQIEIIKGRMNYLDNMVAFSTIQVYIYEPEPIQPSSDWGFIEALKRGIRGAVTVFNYISMFLIATAPVWITIGIILIIVWQAIRARNRRRAKRGNK